jgi:arginyl-tRNA synthetase
MEKIAAALKSVVRDVFGSDITPELTRADEQFGDYATNVALQLAGRLKRPPRIVAEELAAALRDKLAGEVKEVTIAGPGFINLALGDAAVWAAAEAAPASKPQDFKGQVVVTEYSDPNPFKVLHVGHLYTSVVGEAISNLIRVSGGQVHQVNFGGDVGLHVGKTMWAILQVLGGERPAKLQEVPADQRAEWMARAYVQGTQAYDVDGAAKAEILTLNKKVYQLHADNDRKSPFAQIYWTCRQWSYDYFDAFYDRIGSHFEKYYPESAVSDLGIETVREQLAKGVYKESDGAVVFDGEAHGLHTRVFITKQGLPTYEAKDVGLIMSKWRDYHFDRSVIITGNDIVEYMKVVLKSIEQFAPELAQRTAHLTHGNVKLAGGVKMSSRKGNYLGAFDVLDMTQEANKKATGREDSQAVLGAVKYAFLKQRIGADIIYLPEESVSLEGNSGPYLQYAHARARSILRKAGLKTDTADGEGPEATKDSAAVSPRDVPGQNLEPAERSLARKIGEYPEALHKAVNELLPHHVCTYLYELAQAFNRFYEHNRVVGDDREHLRLRLVQLYADVLKDGLGLLGITAPDRM